MGQIVNREVVLASRPDGMPTPENFAIRESVVPDLGSNELLIRNKFMSVDPYMRGRMRAGKSYAAPFQEGEAMYGGAVGTVVASNNANWKEGDEVVNSSGWREYTVSTGMGLNRVDTSIAPMQSFLGIAGMPGQTAYFGLLRVGEPKPGETVFVSAASGAVGGLVCQIAKLHGCRVVGSVGSAAKAQWLRDEAGVDETIVWRDADDLSAELGRVCPDGIDVYFENVGGEHLQAALANMNMYGRVAACGMISTYNARAPQPGPNNLMLIVGNRIRIQGFIVSDFAEDADQFYADLKKWIDAGQVKWQETIVHGIEQAPQAFINLFTGANNGKMLVQLHD